MSLVSLSRGLDVVINASLFIAALWFVVTFVTFVVLSRTQCGATALALLNAAEPQCCRTNGTQCRNYHKTPLLYSLQRGCYCNRCKNGIFPDEPSP
jgi:hypothetical protein